MTRTLPILIGLTVLLTTGVVHGLWTYRWQPSEALARGRERLAALPDHVGSWKGDAYEQEADMIELAGAVAHYSRVFVDPTTGDRVLVMLLVGLPNRMSVHRPEHCYESDGYVMSGPAQRVDVQPKGGEMAEFFSGTFSRDETTGPNQLRIFWSFGAGGQWMAVRSPRLKFAREKVLYKLYVLRNVNQTAGPLATDPCVRLLGELLPVLDRTLWSDE